MKKTLKLFCIVCFLLFLGTTMLVTTFSEKKGYSYYENRSLARPTVLTVDTLLSGEFMQGLSNCFRDHSAGRDYALRLNTWIDLHILKKPVVNQVVVQEDILLPYLPYGDYYEPKVESDSQIMAENLANAKQITEENGGKYFYIAIPCQYAYFAEKYPDYLNNRELLTNSALKHLKADLAEQDVELVDMGEVFAEMGNPAYISSTIDNHYSLKGAYLTYEAMAEKIKEISDWELKMPKDIIFHEMEKPYLGSRPRKLFAMYGNEEHLLYADFGEEVPFTRKDNGIEVPAEVYSTAQAEAGEAVLYTYYMGGDIAETVIQTNRPHLPDILIYGDSFTNALECLAYYSFDEMRSLDFRHYNEKTLEEYIEEYQPDFVVCVRDYETLLSLDGNGKPVKAE